MKKSGTRSKSKSKAKAFLPDSKHWKLKRRFVVFGLLLLVAGLIFLTQRWNRSPPSTEPLVIESIEEQGIQKRDQWVNMTTSELIALAKNLKPDSNATLPVNMQWVNDKLEISRLLSAKTNDDSAQKEATLYRLEALQGLSNLNRKYELKLETVDKELHELSAANLQHPDPEIAKTAAVTIMLSSIHEYFVRPDEGNRKAALQRSLDVARQLKNDPEIAMAIFQYATSMKRNDLLIAGSVEFFNVVLESYWNSDNERARQLARDAHAEILFGDRERDERNAGLLISGLRNRFRQQHPWAEKEAVNRVTFSLHRQLLDPPGVDRMIDMLRALLANNRIQAARELTVAVKQFLAKTGDERFSSAIAPLDELAKQIDMVNQRMDLSNLVTVTHGETWQTDNARPVLLVYWSPGNPASVRMISTLYSRALKRQVQVIAICPSAEVDNVELLQKFAKEMPEFKFLVPRQESEPDKFMAQFPVSKLPCLALLDSKHRLIAANPDLQDLDSRIQDALNQ